MSDSLYLIIRYRDRMNSAGHTIHSFDSVMNIAPQGYSDAVATATVLTRARTQQEIENGVEFFITTFASLTPAQEEALRAGNVGTRRTVTVTL